MRRMLLPSLLAAIWVLPVPAAEPPATWAFRPVVRPEPPKVRGTISNPIDAFLLEKLEANGLTFSRPADPATLLRRVTFDLTGLPPTPEEIDAFLKECSAKPQAAYVKAVDRLLASPRYGERAALPWLDLVRYAETDGFKADDPRPFAWRYRDYVIKSFNADKPFDRFVREQLAGDELWPDDPDALVATGFLRHYPDEYNAINLEQRRQEILNDITDTTGQAFLGLTIGCARCHDHKYDPITQLDYYRLQAFFAGWKPVDAPALPGPQRREYEAKLHDWEAKTAEVRAAIDALERPYRQRFTAKRRGRFPEEYAKILDIPEGQRTPLQKQLGLMVEKQVYAEDKATLAGMKPEEKERHAALLKQLAEAGPRPTAPPLAMAMTDVGPDVPPTKLLKRGDWRKPDADIAPGFLAAIDKRPPEIAPPPHGRTTSRRAALATWLTSPENQLTARVIVNRLWQQHFGKGIVATPGDFGSQGARPTHPELLDYLASELVRNGWRLKPLHRQIVLSRAFQQASAADADPKSGDPENTLLWHMNRRRLDGEAIRDAVLSAAGTLNLKAGGPSVYPELPPEIKPNGWPVSADPAERDRRSVYVCVKRNLRCPLFTAFDAPDRCETCARRYVTTTAPQALMLLNDRLVIAQARLFAARALKEAHGEPEALIDRACRTAFGRAPDSEERVALSAFLRKRTDGGTTLEEAAADLCHALLNANEFIYVD
jgi:hypothetical protein